MMEETICSMGHCQNPRPATKDVCDSCYEKFNDKLGSSVSEAVRKMIGRAELRNKYEVAITRQDIYNVWQEDNKCPIMGTNYTIGGDLDTSPSLDRINPDKGYTPDNIQVISRIANTMKSSASAEQLMRFSLYYLRYYYESYNGATGREL